MILSILTSFFASLAQADEICIACAGKAFSSIAAAFSTQGYYLQADIIEQIFYNGMGSWAMLAYIASACGGLVGVATGASPKNYMWYFMGPALYHWLVGTTYLTHGVSWEVGGMPRDQREVWKIAKTGLETSNYAVRYGVEVDPVQGPSYPAEVADFFAWYDDVTSDTVQQLVSWLAVPYMNNQFGGENITKADVISDAKWRYLQDIVGARFSNPGLQVAFTYFLEGSCGQVLRKFIDQAAFAQAVNQQGRNLRSDFSFFSSPTLALAPDYSAVVAALGARTVSSRQLMTQVFKDQSFVTETDLAAARSVIDGLPGKDFKTRIDCNDYLGVMVQAFRWQAGRIYIEMVKNLPSSITPDQFVAQLFHGWEIPLTVGPAGAQQFLINLIMAHLIGNEFLLAPRSFAIPQYTAGERVIKEFVPNSQRMTQPVSKFSELYVWALMVPYFQGLLLFMLAVAYPFACMLVVMPGFHKVMFTWMSMYLWVKLWDFGFAMVQLIDRGVWASLGNTANARGVNNVVESLAQLHSVTVLNLGAAIPGVPINPTLQVIPLTNYNDYLQIMDLGMQLAFNLDYSLANSYYIYIMSALYFAVPVVLAQLVLSGKGWIADLAKGAIGTMAGDTKGGVQSASVDALTRASKQQFDAQRVAAKMASADSASFMARALSGKNDAELAKMSGAYGKVDAERQQQMLSASNSKIAGAEKAMAAGGSMLRAAGSNLGVVKETLGATQQDLAAVKATMDQKGKELESAKSLVSAKQKALEMQKAAVGAYAEGLSTLGDFIKFTNAAADNYQKRANQLAGKRDIRGFKPGDNRDPDTGEENVEGGGSGSGGGGDGESAGNGSSYARKATDGIVGRGIKLAAGLGIAPYAAAQATQGRYLPGAAAASLITGMDSNHAEAASRGLKLATDEYFAQESRKLSEAGRRADIYGAQMAQLGAQSAGIEQQISTLSGNISRNQVSLTGAQIPMEMAQAQTAFAQSYLSDQESRRILGAQVDAANFAMQQDYTASRLGNQSGVDETRAAFAADMDVSYATQLGGSSVGGVLSAGGVVAGSFTGTAMNDNLKALAFEDALEGDSGRQAAEAGRFFQQGGIFDTTQRGFQSQVATGAQVQEGLGGVAGDLVAASQGASYAAAANSIQVAGEVNNNVNGLAAQLPGISNSVQELKGGVGALPGAGIINEGAPRSMIADVVQATGATTPNAKAAYAAAKELFSGDTEGLKAIGSQIGEQVENVFDGTQRKPDQVDKMEKDVAAKIPSGGK